MRQGQYKSLSGQNIIVTGATSGLGREMALTLATKHGAHVTAIGRRAERLAELTEVAEKLGGSISGVPIDVTDSAAVDDWLNKLKFQRVDGAVLNAGITFCDLFENGSFKEDQRLVDTNIAAILQITRGLLEPLSNKTTTSRLMFIASLGGLIPLPYQAVYAGTKAFVINFGLSLREELKAKNIDLSVFAPGGFDTEMTEIDAMRGLKNSLKSVQETSDVAVEGFINKSGLFLPDRSAKRTAFLAKILPSSFFAKRTAEMYRKARQ